MFEFLEVVAGQPSRVWVGVGVCGGVCVCDGCGVCVCVCGVYVVCVVCVCCSVVSNCLQCYGL